MKEHFQDLDLDSINIDSFMNFLDAKKETNMHVPVPKLKVKQQDSVPKLHVNRDLRHKDIPLTSVPMPSLSKAVRIKKLANIKNLIAEHIKWDKLKVHNFTNTDQKTIERKHPIILQDAVSWLL